MVVESSDSSLFLSGISAYERPTPFHRGSAGAPYKTAPHTTVRTGVHWHKRGWICWALPDPEMNQFAQAATQTLADLTQRVGMGELAEQHRHQLRPATE